MMICLFPIVTNLYIFIFLPLFLIKNEQETYPLFSMSCLVHRKDFCYSEEAFQFFKTFLYFPAGECRKQYTNALVFIIARSLSMLS